MPSLASTPIGTAPPSPRHSVASIHSNDEDLSRFPIVKKDSSDNRRPAALELLNFINRTPRFAAGILSKTLAVLKLLEILSPTDNYIQSIDTVVEACKKLKLIEFSEKFTCTDTDWLIEDVCEEFREKLKLEEEIGKNVKVCASYIFSCFIVTL